MGTNIDKQIEELISNREKFNEFVYTSLDDAIEELKKRQTEVHLDKKVELFLNKDIPEQMKGGMKAVMFRQVVTPNYEIRRFLSVPDATELIPVFWEYYDDKFTSNNPLKYYLGKLGFHVGIGKSGLHRRIDTTIIDFNISN